MAGTRFSQFFVTNLHGDCILAKDFCGSELTTSSTTTDTFRKHIKSCIEKRQSARSIFYINGVTYFDLKINDVYFVATTRSNVNCCCIMEMLNQVQKVLAYFLEDVNQQTIEYNSMLLYELLDEAFDFGYPQQTSSESMQSLKLTHPTGIPAIPKPSQMSIPPPLKKTITIAPIRPPRKNCQEIFVDIIEHLSITFDAKVILMLESLCLNYCFFVNLNPVCVQYKRFVCFFVFFFDVYQRCGYVKGNVVDSSINGSIDINSKLKGNPTLKLKLNDELMIRNLNYNCNYNYNKNNENAPPTKLNMIKKGEADSNDAILDDCNFDECVKLDKFEKERVLLFNAPKDCTFSLMNYRVTSLDFEPPLSIRSQITILSPYIAEIIIKVKATIEEIEHKYYFGSVSVEVPMHDDIKFNVGGPSHKEIQMVTAEFANVNSVQMEGAPNGHDGGRLGGNYNYNYNYHYGDSDKPFTKCDCKFDAKTQKVVCNVKKLHNQREFGFKINVTFRKAHKCEKQVKRMFGPVAVNFDIPMYTVSGLEIRYLRMANPIDCEYAPYRWVRYITKSQSCICRL